jgi:16S rRNA (uracil1498-N3)-methyltransferase
MTAPHFFAADVSSDPVAVTGEEARHAVRVLRIRPGERVTVADGRGSVVEGPVLEAGRDLVVGVAGRRHEPRARPSLLVVQAIPKRGKLDGVVQKLTELGADAFRPVATERSVARWDGPKGRAQRDRLEAIAREAAKQSRRAWLPSVEPPGSLDALEPLPRATFLLHEEAVRRLGEALPVERPEAVAILVGPEGGFTPEEVSRLAGRGAQPVTLGPSILRTETAALAAAVVILCRYGRLG